MTLWRFLRQGRGWRIIFVYSERVTPTLYQCLIVTFIFMFYWHLCLSCTLEVTPLCSIRLDFSIWSFLGVVCIYRISPPNSGQKLFKHTKGTSLRQYTYFEPLSVESHPAFRFSIWARKEERQGKERKGKIWVGIFTHLGLNDNYQLLYTC